MGATCAPWTSLRRPPAGSRRDPKRSLPAVRPYARGASIDLLSEAQAHELPALVGIEEVAIGGARVPIRCDAGRAAQHMLADHELAIVLAQGALRRPVARIRRVGALRPLPDVAK